MTFYWHSASKHGSRIRQNRDQRTQAGGTREAHGTVPLIESQLTLQPRELGVL
jgi:hypothetical protein